MNKIVLITGGGGYIGTHLVSQLLKKGYQVRIFDEFLFGQKPVADFEDNKNVRIIKGDIEGGRDQLRKAMDGVAAVVHLAGLVGDPACSLDENFTIKMNVISTRIVKDLVKELNVPRLIFASSASVYGASDKVMDEESQVNPMSLYAKTKIDSEKELLKEKSDRFHPVILRFGTVYGHSRRPRFDLVGNLFIAQAYIDGKITIIGENQWRCFVHVADVSSAIVKALEAPLEKVEGEIFNVGDKSQNTTIGGLAKLAVEVVKKDKKGKRVELIINYDPTDKRNYIVDFRKISRILHFKASIPLKKGMEEVYKNFKKGLYKGSYRDPVYSNVEMTRLILSTSDVE